MRLSDCVVRNRGARKPSPRGRGWLRSSRVRGYDLYREMVCCSIEARVRPSGLLGAGNIGCAPDLGHYPIEPFLHLFIGEAQLDITVTFNRRAPGFISLDLIEMMLAVELNGQAEVKTTEVRDESGDRNLPAKLQSAKFAVAQLLPKHVFGRRASRAQPPCNVDRAFSHGMQFEHRPLRSQPLTRLLRSHPLPLGEGLRPACEVKR